MKCSLKSFFRKHDKAFARWMPHVNLVYPFYEDKAGRFEREALKLVKQLSRIKPFKVKSVFIEIPLATV